MQGRKQASALQLRTELKSIRVAAERLGTLIKAVSDPAKELLEKQPSVTRLIKPETLDLGRAHCEVGDVWAAANSALKGNAPASVKAKKGPTPKPLLDEIADMAAKDYWSITVKHPARINYNRRGHPVELGGAYVSFLRNILKAVGADCDVDALAVRAVARFKEQIDHMKKANCDVDALAVAAIRKLIYPMKK
jgi:hypothetical protein